MAEPLTLRNLRDILNRVDGSVLDATVQVYNGVKNEMFVLDSVEDLDIIPILSIVQIYPE
jgi:hypothetical protein